MIDETFAPTPYQRRVLSVPEDFDLALLGGRGGGKSVALALLILQHFEKHGGRARVLYLRRSHRGCEDFAQVLVELFGAIYDRATAKYNAAERIWKFGSGAVVELNQAERPTDYSKFQGRSFSMIVIDEATQWPDAGQLDLLRSNLRSTGKVPTRFILAANPGGVGHAWVRKRYITPALKAWHPFVEPDSSRTFVWAPSIFTDNPNLDHEGYRQQLAASCAGDPELLRAWTDGDWNVARGAFFSDVVGQHCQFEPWDPAEWTKRTGWDLYLAHDYGSAAPSVTFVCAESPGTNGPDGRRYPRDSILLLDELATDSPNDLDTGLNWTVPKLAEAIRELAERWSIHPDGVADDACFAKHGHEAGSIADEFRTNGVDFEPAKKGDRVSGWQRMRTLLANAGMPDVPGLYVSTACRYWWETVPTLARDPRRPEDLDSRGPDHGADACRYALNREKGFGGSFQLI